MLESNELDADFFTPAPNTSLATIFTNTQTNRNDENKSLIYTPEAPMNPSGDNDKSIGDVQKTRPACLFATSVSAYEWVENKYKLRENLGFAIVKDSKDEIHHLIIYTSEKRTLSVGTITSTFVVNVKKEVNISYYDNYKKYWLITSQASKVSDIIMNLKKIKVNMVYVTEAETLPETVPQTDKIMSNLHKESLDSDTDTFTNMRNKDSILKRMANMGQSVLPPSKNISKSTDSSDTNEYDHHLLPRHKSKSLSKRHTTEKDVILGKQYSNELNKILPNTIEVHDSIIPDSVKNMEPMYENHMHSFITEQRISNSELRININRLSDKVEILCNKTLSGDLQSHSLVNQNEIVNKLLNEYESKIFAYEKLIKLKGLESNLLLTYESGQPSSVKIDSTIEMDTNKENETDKINELNEKMDLLTKAFSEIVEKHRQHEETLLKEIDALKQDLNDKNETLHTIEKCVQSITANSSSEEYGNKLKNTMNNTFQVISSKFNDDDSYLGSVVKSIVAKIIKKTTMESLNDIN